MKLLTCLVLLLFTACNREASPDGRSQIRDEKIQQEINLLKEQNVAILDSIKIINRKLAEIKAN